jgi:hypothetical protein
VAQILVRFLVLVLVIMEQTKQPIINNSNITPVGSTVNSLVLRCSLVNNNISSATDVIDSFPINGTFGSKLNFFYY